MAVVRSFGNGTGKRSNRSGDSLEWAKARTSRPIRRVRELREAADHEALKSQNPALCGRGAWSSSVQLAGERHENKLIAASPQASRNPSISWRRAS